MIRAIGALDEANAFLGLVKVFSGKRKLKKVIKEIQTDIFSLSAIFAGSEVKFSKTRTKEIEKEIDDLEKKLPPLKNFILPGGSKTGSLLMYSRTLVRRAEREVAGLKGKKRPKPEMASYLNRLSDFLFMLARKENRDKKVKEEVWKGKRR